MFKRNKKPSYYNRKTRRNIKKLEKLCIKNNYMKVYSADGKSSIKAINYYSIYDVDSIGRIPETKFEYKEYDNNHNPIYKLVYDTHNFYKTWYDYKTGKRK